MREIGRQGRSDTGIQVVYVADGRRGDFMVRLGPRGGCWCLNHRSHHCRHANFVRRHQGG
jgi:hypothetical protein